MFPFWGRFFRLVSGASACCQFQGVPGYFLPKTNRGLARSAGLSWKTGQTQDAGGGFLLVEKLGGKKKKHVLFDKIRFLEIRVALI